MARIDVGEILRMAEEDFERAWVESAKLLRDRGRFFKLRRDQGETNYVFDLIQRIRRILVDMGFKELLLPSIADESEVRKQYGPEANVILDRVFYLAKLPRPEIGLDKRRVEAIRRIVPGFDKVEELKSILRRYKEGSIEADDLVETMVLELGVREEQATAIIDGVFPEFRELKPIPTTLTLRSHTTTLWFPTLAILQDRMELPIQLFTVGLKFRREERLDESHLYESYTASLVVMAEEVSLEDGEEIVVEFLSRLGFEEVENRRKRATSKYYAPGMEFEVFVRNPATGEWVEVGDAGLYSPVALARYGIEYPVFNAGFGVERIAMVMLGETDIRRVAYPHIYKPLTLTDEDIARGVSLIEEPETELGRRVMEAIVRCMEEHASDPSPVELKAWEGVVGDLKAEAWVWERDPGVKLLGPAAMNEVWVVDGNILGLIPDEEVKRRGVYTGIRYLDAVAAMAARRLELLLERGGGEETIRVRVARLPSDVNLAVSRLVRKYVTGLRKRIDIRGPVFIGITVRAWRCSPE